MKRASTTIQQTVVVSFPVIATLTLLMGATAFAIDASIPAIPATATFFNAPIGSVQLTVGFYLLGYAIGQIPVGFLADSYGRRPVILAGMSLFAIMGMLAANSASVEMLLLCRFLQGVCGASGAVLSRAVARDITDGRETARLLSLLASTLGIVMLTAPIIGALVLGLAGWRAPFLTSSVFAVCAVASTWFFIPETRPDGPVISPLIRFNSGLSAYFKNHQTLFGTLLGCLSISALMSFITLSSEVFIVGLNFSALNYALVYSTVSVGYLIGGIACRELAGNYSSLAVSRVIATGFLICGVAIAVLSALDSKCVIALLIVFAAMFACIGAMLAITSAIALEPMPQAAGMAAALLGTIQLLTGALTSVILSKIGFNAASLLPGYMLAVCVMIVVASAVQFRLGVRSE